MVPARLSKWQGWSSGGKKRDVTHVPSDVESISHDHLPESEITTRSPVSREPGMGPGNRGEMGKYPETQRGVKRRKMREEGEEGINNAVCSILHRLASLFSLDFHTYRQFYTLSRSALHIRGHSFCTLQTLRSLSCDDIIFLIALQRASSIMHTT